MIKRSDLELTVDVRDSQSLLGRLKSFHLDAILCDVPFAHSEDEPLIQREIAKEPMCLIGRRIAPSLALAVRLSRQGIYLPARSNPITAEVESYLRKRNEDLLVKGYIDDIGLLRLLAIETDSIVAIPRIGAARELKNRTLSLLHQFKSLYQKFYLVLRQNGSRSEKILELLEQD